MLLTGIYKFFDLFTTFKWFVLSNVFSSLKNYNDVDFSSFCLALSNRNVKN
jgi:hypothetical protein